MNEVKREFNLKLYHQCDMSAKKAVIALMKNKGYELDGDINKEHYKKYDLRFKNANGDVISVENEYRGNFAKIRDFFPTVHIPIRKKGSQCDYYFVWGLNYTEMGLIKMSDIIKFSDKPVNVLCTQAMELYDGDVYREDFIDVPKSLVTFFKLNENGFWKINQK
jgi:hypothetical protein